MARRPRTMPASVSTTTAVATLGSLHRTKSSLPQASTSRPSITRGASGAPHLKQKWPMPERVEAPLSDGLRLRLGRVRLRRRPGHVRDPDLVPAALLGDVKRLVGAVDELREKVRLLGRGDADADGQLQPAGERGAGNLGPNPLG